MRMIANTMPFVDYALVNIRILTDIVAYHKEGGFYPVLRQYIKDIGRGFGYGAVIKGQID